MQENAPTTLFGHVAVCAHPAFRPDQANVDMEQLSLENSVA